MESIGYSELLTRFQLVPLKNLNFITPINRVFELFSQESQQPENLSESLYDPNDFYIEPKQQIKKKTSTQANKQILLIGKAEEKKQDQKEEKVRNYRPGPFALFYQLNQGTLDKDAEVWYYKENKNIVGPVSSYNMDKMVFYKKLEEQTRVAFKTIDKFVKFGKIKKVVQEESSQ